MLNSLVGRIHCMVVGHDPQPDACRCRRCRAKCCQFIQQDDRVHVCPTCGREARHNRKGHEIETPFYGMADPQMPLSERTYCTVCTATVEFFE